MEHVYVPAAAAIYFSVFFFHFSRYIIFDVFLSFFLPSSTLEMCLINTPFVSDVARTVIGERERLT